MCHERSILNITLNKQKWPTLGHYLFIIYIINDPIMNFLVRAQQ